MPEQHDGDMPLFTNLLSTNLVDASTGQPVGPDAGPDTQVVAAEQFGKTGRRVVPQSLGHLVTTDGVMLGRAAPGLHETQSGQLVHVNEIGQTERLGPVQPPASEQL